MKRIAALLLPLLLLAGCSKNLVCVNAGEVEDFEIVQTVGVDRENGLILLTAATGGGASGEVSVMQSRGGTIRRAMQLMQDRTEKKYLFFGETRSFLIGEDAAGEDISVYLETVERGVDMRLDTKVYIVRGSTAAEAIAAASEQGQSVNERLSAIEEDVRLVSESYVYDCGETAESLAENGSAVVAALELAERGELLEQERELTLRVPGYALIREGTLRGFVTGEEARGLTLLCNKGKIDIVEVPDGAGGLASVELTGAACRYDASFGTAGLESVRVCLELRGSVAGMETPLDLYDPSVIAALESSFARVEGARAQAALDRMRLEKQDVVGAGSAIRRAHPILFRRYCAGDWPQALFTAPWTLEVRAVLERTYDLGISPSAGETGGKR